MKTTDRQPTEVGPRIADGEERRCFVCKAMIQDGQEYYRATNSAYHCRHIDCARLPVRLKKERHPIPKAANGRVIRSPRGL